MKISYQWLKEFVELEQDPRDLAARLTMAGLAVDAVEPYGHDSIFEIDLTSNRPDCLSHLGVAREASALSGRPLKPRAVEPERAAGKNEGKVSIEILDPALCPRYTARVIRGVKIGPSPAWLVDRLEAMGQRSVNNVADITNYVMLEMGQPLHAFDLNMLRGKRIIVRTAAEAESITTLDGEHRVLTPDMLVIADAERPVALAGVKGGEDSGVSPETVDVLLEAAYFAPAQVRSTSRALGLSTEASYRFERGTDPEIVIAASNRAAALIEEIAGGAVVGELIDVYPVKATRAAIEFRKSRYEALTGLNVTLAEAERILRSLGFEVRAEVENERLHAVAPSWRVDIAIEEDLIEEVARISGYDKLQNRLPGSAGAGAYLKGENGRRRTRFALAQEGFYEAINFSFVNQEADAAVTDAPSDRRLVLQNPIDETQSHMRTTLLGGLLKSVEHNLNQGERDLRLFEIGKCFLSSQAERPIETERLALVATGARNENDWKAASARVDFFDLKGAVESIADSLGLPALEFSPAATIAHFHPGRAAVISLGQQTIGRIGQLHPRVAAGFKFKQPVYLAELDLGALLDIERLDVRYAPLPKFPSVGRDLALLVDKSVSFAAIEAAIHQLKIPELAGVRVFDIYDGKELPEGKHSIALSIWYRSPDRTLTNQFVSEAHDRVIETVKREFQAEVR